jgi:3-oxoacyl-[acyl-carrier-protein] synthase II
VEAIATIGALRTGTAPPTLGYEEPEEGLDLDYVTEGARPIHPSGNGGANGNGGGRPLIAISNSFGFGGHNAVLCLAAR